jgi:hypothetical protein
MPPIMKGVMNHARLIQHCHMCIAVLMKKRAVNIAAAGSEGS